MPSRGDQVSIPADIVRDTPGLGEWSILTAWRGSVAHGMFVPNTDPHSIDDKDIIAVCVPPLENYFGLHEFAKRGTQETKRDEWDILVYEVRKALHLLQQGNPNILSMLWLPEDRIIKKTSAGSILLAKRDLFVGRWSYHSFVGYAMGQLKRLNTSGRPEKASAYIAGIFDGEGHVSIHRTSPLKSTHAPVYYLEVGVTNTDRDLIEGLLSEHGGYVGRTGIRGQHRTDAYRWRLTGPPAAKWLRTMIPFLRIKRRQAEIGVAFADSVAVRRRGKPLTDDEIAERETLCTALKMSRNNKHLAVPLADDLMDASEERYATAYMGEKRKRLVETYGYDCKNAAHLIRLLRMACEFLKTGELLVDRGGLDATELLDIKHGEWTLERVKAEADRLFVRAEEAYDRCTLPDKPDRDAISELCAEIVWTALHDRGETI